jgi:prepilin-type N-terminal cleavage/methylation domain-containing protein
MKMYFKNNRGFTLIELLVTISIISLLSSIVFTTLNGAKVKAKDASLKQEAVEMGKIFDLSLLNGNYNNYGGTGLWVGFFVHQDCSDFTGSMASEAQKICAAIYKTGVGDFGDPGWHNMFLIGIRDKDTGDNLYNHYSITIKLNSGNVFCLSDLGTYEGIDPFNNGHPCYWYKQ